MTIPEFLNTKEYGAKFRVHWRTVISLIKKGEISAVKVGDQYRIPNPDFKKGE